MGINSIILGHFSTSGPVLVPGSGLDEGQKPREETRWEQMARVGEKEGFGK